MHHNLWYHYYINNTDQEQKEYRTNLLTLVIFGRENNLSCKGKKHLSK